MARAGAQAAAENPQGLTHGDRWRMSALPPKADITRLACPLCANRVLTRRSKSTASLPGPMLINCTQTESMPLEEDHVLALGRLETALCQRVKLESSGAIFMSAKRPPMSIATSAV